ncbi:ATP-binding cassette domain-containing protein [Candidatus Halocynthiibacter alkanivorans]|uniref:ATP-binding cassette domain-containing protein n=1 Tax=Candidatus Halocynthiibacter alkanivorans TaxID=2267619 RepID=UPI001F230F96|nr:ATP-binding cassette domain-containing protein [Candidatus Halocynthiibacter alkanivorans]
MVTSILPLTLSGATVKRGKKTLLGPVDMTVSPRGFTIILGPNGAGKTTLLRALHGLEHLDSGSARWQVPLRDARSRQGFVFQAPVMMRRNVRDSLAYPLIVHGVRRKEARQRAGLWAEKIGLGDMLDQAASQLSGGEKQKLALARALIRDPEILFLDEPCANLDGRATREIEAILQTAQANGTRILMSTHDIGQARRLASDVVFLMGGRIIETGPATTFFHTPSTPQAVALLNGDIVE